MEDWFFFGSNFSWRIELTFNGKRNSSLGVSHPADPRAFVPPLQARHLQAAVVASQQPAPLSVLAWLERHLGSIRGGPLTGGAGATTAEAGQHCLVPLQPLQQGRACLRSAPLHDGDHGDGGGGGELSVDDRAHLALPGAGIACLEPVDDQPALSRTSSWRGGEPSILPDTTSSDCVNTLQSNVKNSKGFLKLCLVRSPPKANGRSLCGGAEQGDHLTLRPHRHLKMCKACN